MSPSDSYHIRRARPDDVHDILALITDLVSLRLSTQDPTPKLSQAIYEKEPDAVKATPELLRKNLFGDTPYAHALLAYTGSVEGKGEAIGLALYFFNFSTWTGKPGLYLEDLELGRIAEEKGCPRIDWVVLTWNQPSIDFYEKRLGAKRMSDWVGMRLEQEGIANLRNLV
ncbi:hypothetical protein NMY22_g17890 [Coprinellus aureogranulatus]|nr:hypothetical protein NMY22_g17890 [Coprinellus aureogranulatus]